MRKAGRHYVLDVSVCYYVAWLALPQCWQKSRKSHSAVFCSTRLCEHEIGIGRTKTDFDNCLFAEFCWQMTTRSVEHGAKGGQLRFESDEATAKRTAFIDAQNESK